MPNFRLHCHLLFFFNSLSLEKKFIRKVEIRELSNTVDPDMNRLIWICAVCKSLLLSPVVVKVKKITLLFDFTCYNENLLSPPFRRKAEGHCFGLSVVRGAWCVACGAWCVVRVAWFRIFSSYLVPLTPPTFFVRFFWNFTGALKMVWRYACGFFRILKLFFITFYTFWS